MTDQELDVLLDQARPTLRTALRQVIEQKQTAMMFPLGLIKFPNEQKWDITCFVMIEPLAKLIAPLVLHGIPGMFESQIKPHLKPGQVLPEPLKHGSGGLQVPL